MSRNQDDLYQHGLSTKSMATVSQANRLKLFNEDEAYRACHHGNEVLQRIAIQEGDFRQQDNVPQQGDVKQQGESSNQLGNFYPQGGFDHWRVYSTQTMPFMDVEEFQAYTQGSHSDIRQPANFDQQNELCQQTVDTNFQTDQTNLSDHRQDPRGEGCERLWTSHSKWTAMIGHNKLLKAAADNYATGFASPSANDPIIRSADDSRNLEYNWILGSLWVNLIYLQARRRREQAKYEMRG
ncbi:hypothetical protein Pdw03_2741 [Penicillium digitatum]|nr:hypothetical protein Pdw03_2741 [Penicillium digitatum]